MVTLLIDANLDGHAELLTMRLRTEPWRDLLDHLGIRFLHFEQAGLDRTIRDDALWRFCQQKNYYLLTANRNLESEDSLEATIRRENRPQSLPVFTFADADRLFRSGDYLDAVVERLLEYLLEEENFRGTGRLFLP